MPRLSEESQELVLDHLSHARTLIDALKGIEHNEIIFWDKVDAAVAEISQHLYEVRREISFNSVQEPSPVRVAAKPRPRATIDDIFGGL